MTELLYNKSKAVAALNKVEGFNPLELARRISNEGEAEQLYLDVKYRKLWFRLLNPTGKIISNIISLTENTAAPDPSAAPPIQGSTPMMEQFYQNAQANGNTIGGMNGIPTLQNQALDPNLPAEELINRMTYEQALSVTVTCGRLKNKTMGQVAMESPSSLGWYANEYSGKDHLMIAAARVILQRALPMAG